MDKRRPLTQIPSNRSNSQRKSSRRFSETDINGYMYEKCPGFIEKMILKNFMCHGLLEINFRKNISFITGQNGSGKSAILTALTVVLGGKASTTNRGTSIKNFIRAGRNSGSVEIVLRNEGPLAYKRHMYGNKIIINRTFSTGGGSAYKIKAEKGEVVSTKFQEIKHIRDALNLQVDNPVCVLNQDTSRNFLSTTDSKQRFILFMRATRLDTLVDTISRIESNKDDSLKLWKEREIQYKKLQEDLKVLKTKVENHKANLVSKEQLKLFQCELLWATVRDFEEEFNHQKSAVENLTKKCEEIEELCNQIINNLEEIKIQIRNMQKQIAEINLSRKSESRRQADIKVKLLPLREEFEKKRRERHLLQNKLQTKKKEQEHVEKTKSEISENIANIEKRKTEKANKLAKIAKEMSVLNDVLETTRNELFQLRNHLSHKQSDANNLKNEISQIAENIARQKNSMRVLKNDCDNSLILFGGEMPRIVETINSMKNKFKCLPRGPLGQYITLKDKKWTVAIEGYLGERFLHAFVVDNKEDNMLLMKIFEKFGSRKPMVITTRFINIVHNVTRNLVKVPSDCAGLFASLIISDPVVANCIIDQMQPEGVLLIPSTERAIELMSDSSNVPFNCKQGVTIKGDRFYPDPNYKTYGSNYHRAKYLQTNTKEQVKHLEDQIKKLEESKISVCNQLKALESENTCEQRKLDELERKIKKLSVTKKLLKDENDSLNAADESESVDSQTLETELNEIKRNINLINVSLENIDVDISNKKDQISELEKEFDGIRDVVHGLEEQIMTSESLLRNLMSEEVKLAQKKESIEKRLNESKNKLNLEKSKMLEQETDLKQKTEEASNIGARMNKIRQVPEIMEHINKLKKVIRAVESSNENFEDVVVRYQLHKDKVRELSEIMNTLYEDIAELQSAIEKRRRHYKFTEDFFVSFAKHAFEEILEHRQFKGTLDIKMNDKILDLNVIPQHGSQGLTTTANLSGGERSFSTVAFLYALWQCMDFPFYFLDEFDVYMDKVNRMKVMEILLEFAKTKPEFQFVFLTPQDVSFIHDDNVDIHRLDDPERINT